MGLIWVVASAWAGSGLVTHDARLSLYAGAGGTDLTLGAASSLQIDLPMEVRCRDLGWSCGEECAPGVTAVFELVDAPEGVVLEAPTGGVAPPVPSGDTGDTGLPQPPPGPTETVGGGGGRSHLCL